MERQKEWRVGNFAVQLTLIKSDVRNDVNVDLGQEIVGALERIPIHKTARTVILARGDKAFAAAGAHFCYDGRLCRGRARPCLAVRCSPQKH